MTEPAPAHALDHLFRRQSGRMTAALVRAFGLANLGLAEDAVQDALCRALATWKIHGLPDDPAAWLMAAAKNRAIDLIRREKTARAAAPGLAWALLASDRAGMAAPRLAGELQDGELAMMFSCCHPRIPEEAQVALILQLLCGFSVREISAAFLLGEAAVGKRVERARAALSRSGKLYEVSRDEAVQERLPAVCQAIYLLFNEGYHGANPKDAVRGELCAEALRLCVLLRESPATARPATHALFALLALNAARLPARVNQLGDLVQLQHQDRARWDQGLIAQGLAALAESASGDALSEFHLEAAIAAEHALAPAWEETRWAAIVGLYDLLYRVRPTPIVGLNRAIAIAQGEGPERGLEEIGRIAGLERLADYPFHPAALGELHLRAGRPDQARLHFQAALRLSRNPPERRLLQSRLEALTQAGGIDPS